MGLKDVYLLFFDVCKVLLYNKHFDVTDLYSV